MPPALDDGDEAGEGPPDEPHGEPPGPEQGGHQRGRRDPEHPQPFPVCARESLLMVDPDGHDERRSGLRGDGDHPDDLASAVRPFQVPERRLGCLDGLPERRRQEFPDPSARWEIDEDVPVGIHQGQRRAGCRGAATEVRGQPLQIEAGRQDAQKLSVLAIHRRGEVERPASGDAAHHVATDGEGAGLDGPAVTGTGGDIGARVCAAAPDPALGPGDPEHRIDVELVHQPAQHRAALRLVVVPDGGHGGEREQQLPRPVHDPPLPGRRELGLALRGGRSFRELVLLLFDGMPDGEERGREHAEHRQHEEADKQTHEPPPCPPGPHAGLVPYAFVKEAGYPWFQVTAIVV
jgi:hypothetical protein